jgi:hypothetical protein
MVANNIITKNLSKKPFQKFWDMIGLIDSVPIEGVCWVIQYPSQDEYAASKQAMQLSLRQNVSATNQP